MKWVVEIGKFAVNMQNDCGYNRTYQIKPGWMGSADKVDEFIIVKIVSVKDKDAAIHLCMIPAADTSLLWVDIDEMYRKFGS